MKKFVLTLMILLMPCYGWGAINFDDIDDFVTCGNNADVGNGDYTISVWIIPSSVDASTTTRVIVGKRPSGGGVYPFQLEMNDTGPTLRIGITSYDGSSSYRVNDTSDVVVDTLYHIAGVYDSGANKLRLYINGSEVGTPDDTTGHADWSNSASYTIGHREQTTSRLYFPGEINEVAIWSSVLTAAEISSLYTAKYKRLPLQIQPSNLSIYTALDDVSDGSSADGSTFIDLSGNVNDCTADDGANNTGMTGVAETVLTYP